MSPSTVIFHSLSLSNLKETATTKKFLIRFFFPLFDSHSFYRCRQSPAERLKRGESKQAQAPSGDCGQKEEKKTRGEGDLRSPAIPTPSSLPAISSFFFFLLSVVSVVQKQKSV